MIFCWHAEPTFGLCKLKNACPFWHERLPQTEKSAVKATQTENFVHQKAHKGKSVVFCAKEHAKAIF